MNSSTDDINKIVQERIRNTNNTVLNVNLLDEIDSTILGYIEPTLHFIFSFNSFVEAFVLSDTFSFELNEINRMVCTDKILFPDGRPISKLILDNNELACGFSIPNQSLKTQSLYFLKDSTKENFHNVIKEFHDNFLEDYSKWLKPEFDITKKYNSFPFMFFSTPEKNDRITLLVAKYSQEINEYVDSIFNYTKNSNQNIVFPFCGIEYQFQNLNNIPVHLDVFKLIESKALINIRNINEILGYQGFNIPSLVSILLSRCKTINEINGNLVKLREEFKDFRIAIDSFNKMLTNVSDYKDIKEIVKCFNPKIETTNSLFIKKRLFNSFFFSEKKRKINFIRKQIINTSDFLDSTPLIQFQVKKFNEVFKTEIDTKNYHHYNNFLNRINYGIHQKQRSIIKEIIKYNDQKTTKLFSVKTNEKILLNDVINSVLKLQGISKSIQKDENSRNTYLSSILEAKGYKVKDQTLWGLSESKKNIGEIDIKIEDENNNAISIIESFIISNLNKNTISRHLIKLFEYDRTGLNENFAISYCESLGFDNLCNKYAKFILTINYKYELKESIDISSKLKLGTDIRIIESTHYRNSKNISLYHILINMK